MPKSIVVYARSEGSDDPTNKIESLRNAAADRGWVVTGTYTDQTRLAPKGGTLAGLAALLDAVRAGSVHTVLVASLTQLGTSLESLVDHLAPFCTWPAWNWWRWTKRVRLPTA